MFYDIFEALCRERKIAPSALARKLGMSPSTPGRWRTGSAPDLETAQKLAEFFGVTIDYLVSGEEKYKNAASYVSGGSAVIQGSNVNSVSVSNHANKPDELDGFEAELIRIYRSLGIKGKSELLQSAFELEEANGKAENR